MDSRSLKIKLTAYWVRKLTDKPAFLTSADCECKARRIHLTDYDAVLPVPAAESNAFRIQSELDWLARLARLASLDRLDRLDRLARLDIYKIAADKLVELLKAA